MPNLDMDIEIAKYNNRDDVKGVLGDNVDGRL
jgi:hypothetical protein